jgi:hypothetical protein
MARSSTWCCEVTAGALRKELRQQALLIMNPCGSTASPPQDGFHCFVLPPSLGVLGVHVVRGSDYWRHWQLLLLAFQTLLTRLVAWVLVAWVLVVSAVSLPLRQRWGSYPWRGVTSV